MTTIDPKQLFDLSRATLVEHGWVPNTIGNILKHPDLPHAETRVHYTGGQIFIHGWHTVNGEEQVWWGSGSKPVELIEYARTIHKHLTEAEQQWQSN